MKQYYVMDRGIARGVAVNVLDCNILISEFELQSRFYVHLRTNTFGERYEPPYPSAMS